MPENDVETGYFLKRSVWGKSCATEACQRLLRFAFEESPIDEVFATVDKAHTVSQKVLEKCGLTHQGTRRAFSEEIPYFRITREQWIVEFKP